MLFGHVENARQRVDHLMRLRALQDETGGFQAFIPLAFHPENTRLAHLGEKGDRHHLPERPATHLRSVPGFAQMVSVPFFPPSGLDILRTVAVARLVLDNFDHIKAYWISLGVGTAQVALAYGADDLDGPVRQEKIHPDAGAASPEILPVDERRALIAEAGCEPVERDALYRPVERNGRAWNTAVGTSTTIS